MQEKIFTTKIIDGVTLGIERKDKKFRKEISEKYKEYKIKKNVSGRRMTENKQKGH